MEGSRRFFRRKSTTSSSRTHLLVKDRRPFGIQTRARGAGQVRPDTNMDGGPFKLPTKENADAARKKKVRRVPSASTTRVIERPTNAFPYRQPTAISPRHPTHLTAQEAIATVKKWVESHIPTKHIKDRTCVVDVSEVRAPIPSFTRTAVRAPSTASDRSSSPYTSENERSAVCNRTTHAPPTDPHTDPPHTTPAPTHRSYAATPSAPR